MPRFGGSGFAHWPPTDHPRRCGREGNRQGAGIVYSTIDPAARDDLIE